MSVRYGLRLQSYVFQVYLSVDPRWTKLHHTFKKKWLTVHIETKNVNFKLTIRTISLFGNNYRISALVPFLKHSNSYQCQFSCIYAVMKQNNIFLIKGKIKNTFFYNLWLRNIDIILILKYRFKINSNAGNYLFKMRENNKLSLFSYLTDIMGKLRF